MKVPSFVECSLYAKRGVSGKIVISDELEKVAAKFIKGMEGSHVKGSHPLILYSAAPPFDLVLLCRRVGMAVTDGSSKS